MKQQVDELIETENKNTSMNDSSFMSMNKQMKKPSYYSILNQLEYQNRVESPLIEPRVLNINDN